jgi:hypothetical protein
MPAFIKEKRQRNQGEEKTRKEARIHYRRKWSSGARGWTLALGSILTVTIVLANWRVDARHDKVEVSEAEMRTRISAYLIATRDFVRKMTHGATFAGNSFQGRIPKVAPFSPDKVKLLTPDRYTIDLVFEGYDATGNPSSKIATYSVRCSEGLCTVMDGPNLAAGQ